MSPHQTYGVVSPPPRAGLCPRLPLTERSLLEVGGAMSGTGGRVPQACDPTQAVPTGASWVKRPTHRMWGLPANRWLHLSESRPVEFSQRGPGLVPSPPKSCVSGDNGPSWTLGSSRLLRFHSLHHVLFHKFMRTKLCRHTTCVCPFFVGFVCFFLFPSL